MLGIFGKVGLVVLGGVSVLDAGYLVFTYVRSQVVVFEVPARGLGVVEGS